MPLKIVFVEHNGGLRLPSSLEMTQIYDLSLPNILAFRFENSLDTICVVVVSRGGGAEAVAPVPPSDRPRDRRGTDGRRATASIVTSGRRVRGGARPPASSCSQAGSSHTRPDTARHRIYKKKRDIAHANIDPSHSKWYPYLG
ncbi:unnamed protein product [Euphydryas editha]|uniref:Uncharacterized protein n=1 Tax=Euphydryas editha TaxID=104508 RepID=A0AAU9UMK6_EUPED|nr:unnamed protein product [Euphydryas editha]